MTGKSNRFARRVVAAVLGAAAVGMLVATPAGAATTSPGHGNGVRVQTVPYLGNGV